MGILLRILQHHLARLVDLTLALPLQVQVYSVHLHLKLLQLLVPLPIRHLEGLVVLLDLLHRDFLEAHPQLLLLVPVIQLQHSVLLHAQVQDQQGVCLVILQVVLVAVRVALYLEVQLRVIIIHLCSAVAQLLDQPLIAQVRLGNRVDKVALLCQISLLGQDKMWTRKQLHSEVNTIQRR